MDETVLTTRQDETGRRNGAGSFSNTLQLPLISHCSASKEDLRDEHNAETLKISSPSFDNLDQTDHINVDSLSINLDQTNQALEGRCRKTYVVSSCHESPLKKRLTVGLPATFLNIIFLLMKRIMFPLLWTEARISWKNPMVLVDTQKTFSSQKRGLPGRPLMVTLKHS